MNQLKFESRHNVVANLNETRRGKNEFRQIIHCLQNSETTSTAEVSIYENLIREFWNTAESTMTPRGRRIIATIAGQWLTISTSVIHAVLNLRNDGHTTYTDDEMRNIFGRMGCKGDVHNLYFLKKNVGYQWRHFWHVIIHCLADKKSGWDHLNLTLAVGVAAMGQNEPINWASLIFNNLLNNISAVPINKFMMYPRFIQLIIDAKISQVHHTGAQLVVNEVRGSE